MKILVSTNKLLATLWLTGQVFGAARAFDKRQLGGPTEFDWSTIEPSADLKYHDCYAGLRCARFLVPLDWTKHNSTEGLDDNEMVALAVLKLPANVSQSDSRFGGTIMLQPGGPGGSATQFVPYRGPKFQQELGSDRQFDIIGFDIRGVGESTPPLGCFPNDLAAILAGEQYQWMNDVDSSPQALRYHLESYKGFWDLCLDAATKSPVFEYSTTASAARDMLALVDQVEASRPPRGNATSGSKEKQEKGMLHYYGSSYGTYIGTTFASMYPDRVGLMVLDSVLDTDGYNSGDWISSVEDMEDSINAWWEACFQAGEACALWKDTDRSPTSIKDRVDNFIQDLETAPIFTGVGYGGRIQAITSSYLRSVLLQLAYNDPRYPWTLAALGIIARIMEGDELTALGVDLSEDRGRMCSGPGGEPDQVQFRVSDAQKVIRCIDSYEEDGSERHNVTWAEKVLEAHKEQTQTAGSMTAQWALECYGLPFKPNWVFKGPFGSPAPDTSSNTTIVAPILMLSNRIDPVASTSAAFRLSERHEGSVVVVQNATGHVVDRDDALCVWDIIQEYYASGILPKNGTVCELGPVEHDAEGPEVDDLPEHLSSLSRLLPMRRAPKHEE